VQTMVEAEPSIEAATEKATREEAATEEVGGERSTAIADEHEAKAEEPASEAESASETTEQ